MTRKIYSTFAMMGLFLVLAVGSVQAQSGSSLEINIRFDFQIGSKVLPAGTYTVRRLSQNSMVVESKAGGERVIAQTPGTADGGGKETPAKLVFHQYGDQYFLAQVWLDRDADGRKLIKSNAEREASEAQTLARGDRKPRTVEVTASAR